MTLGGLCLGGCCGSDGSGGGGSGGCGAPLDSGYNCNGSSGNYTAGVDASGEAIGGPINNFAGSWSGSASLVQVGGFFCMAEAGTVNISVEADGGCNPGVGFQLGAICSAASGGDFNGAEMGDTAGGPCTPCNLAGPFPQVVTDHYSASVSNSYDLPAGIYYFSAVGSTGAFQQYVAGCEWGIPSTAAGTVTVEVEGASGWGAGCCAGGTGGGGTGGSGSVGFSAPIINVPASQPFTSQVTTSGTSGTLTYSLVSPPAGVTIHSSTGLISGTISTPGTYLIEVEVSSSTPGSAPIYGTLAVTVTPAVVILTDWCYPAAVASSPPLTSFLGLYGTPTWTGLDNVLANSNSLTNTTPAIGTTAPNLDTYVYYAAGVIFSGFNFGPPSGATPVGVEIAATFYAASVPSAPAPFMGIDFYDMTDPSNPLQVELISPDGQWATSPATVSTGDLPWDADVNINDVISDLTDPSFVLGAVGVLSAEGHGADGIDFNLLMIRMRIYYTP